MTKEAFSYCRQCPSFCGLKFQVKSDRITGLKANTEHINSRGYKCIKADMSLDFMHGADNRLFESLRRDPDGGLVPTTSEQLMDEVASTIGNAIRDHGPNSVAFYLGTQAYRKTFNLSMSKQFVSAIGSDRIFSTMTIDQSAHWVVDGRMGIFATGKPSILDCDTVVLAGTNPVISHSGPYQATPTVHQVAKFKEFRQRGGKLVVIDPRLTETARLADLHLQVRPGYDTEVFAGLIRIVLSNGWHDRAFCDRWVSGLTELEKAVAPFTPELVAERAGIPAEQLLEAASIIARSRQLSIGFSTGVSMSPTPNTAAHMIEALNAICGGYVRAGDTHSNRGVFSRKSTVEAVIAPSRTWESSSRLESGFGQLYGEFPTSRLADEILADSPSRIRILIVLGANPVITFGDPARIKEALSSLDCLVVIDPRRTETVDLADYVVAPPLQWEIADFNLLVADWVERPYLQYADPVVPAPDGTIEEWKFFNGLANRLGHTLRVKPFGLGGQVEGGGGIPLTADRDWATEELLDIALAEVGTSVAELRQHPNGQWVSEPPATVTEGAGTERLDLCPPDVREELNEVISRTNTGASRKYRLICRRLLELMNSEFKDADAVAKRFGGGAPLFMHPDDMAEEGFEPKSLVHIKGEHGQISAHAWPDRTLRRGVVAMPHSWNGVPGAPRAEGHTSWLVSMAIANVAPIDGMPLQSSIPVDLQMSPLPDLAEGNNASLGTDSGVEG